MSDLELLSNPAVSFVASRSLSTWDFPTCVRVRDAIESYHALHSRVRHAVHCNGIQCSCLSCLGELFLPYCCQRCGTKLGNLITILLCSLLTICTLQEMVTVGIAFNLILIRAKRCRDMHQDQQSSYPQFTTIGPTMFSIDLSLSRTRTECKP